MTREEALPSKERLPDRGRFVAVPDDILAPLLKLGWNATRVFLVLEKHADWKTRECWPSYGRMHAVYGIPSRQVALGIRALEKVGYIKLARRPRQPNLYKIQFSLDKNGCSFHGKAACFQRESQPAFPEKEELSPREQSPSNDPHSLSVSLRSTALKTAASFADEGITSGEVTEEVVDDVLRNLERIPDFTALDLSHSSTKDVVRIKLEEFTTSREKALKEGKDTKNWYLRCLHTWFRDMRDLYSGEPFRWGEGRHLMSVSLSSPASAFTQSDSTSPTAQSNVPEGSIAK